MGARISTCSESPADQPLGESKTSWHSRIKKIEEAPFRSVKRVRRRSGALGGKTSLFPNRGPVLCSSRRRPSTGLISNPSASLQRRDSGAIRGAVSNEEKEGLLLEGYRGHNPKPIEEAKIGAKMSAIIKWNRRPYFTQVKLGVRRVTWVLPYNNRFNPSVLGRHVVCLRKRRAGSFGSLLLRRRDLSPSPAG